MKLLIFSHGNSFPANTYRSVLQRLEAEGFKVHSIEKFGHDPRYPVTSNWPYLVQQLADFARPIVEAAGQRAIFVGHSLGGLLSAMCASEHPKLAASVVLLDAPLIGGWQATALRWAKRSGLIGKVSPGKVSQSRVNQWPNEQAVYDYFKSKRVFADWNEGALRDYVQYGTVIDPQDNARQARRLSFDRDVETRIYNTLPDHLETQFRRAPIRCPVSFIGGTRSKELKQAGLRLTKEMTKGRMVWIEGTHHFPMEQVEATVRAIIEAVRKMENETFTALDPS